MIEETSSGAGKDDELALRIRSMERNYAAKMPARLEQMNAALQLFRDNIGDVRKRKEHMNTLFHLLHSIGGSAGAFGFDELGLQAFQLEQKLSAHISADVWSEQALTELSSGLSALEHYFPVIQ